MSITEALSELRAEIKASNLDDEGRDDEELIEFALHFLTANIEFEFNEIDSEEFNYNDFHELKPGDEGYVAS